MANPEQIAKFRAFVYDGITPANTLSQIASEVATKIATIVKTSNAPLKVLDLGCGAGELTGQILAELRAGFTAIDVTALDINAAATTEYANRLRKNGFAPSPASGEAFVFRTISDDFEKATCEVEAHGPFDLVLSFFFFHHLSNIPAGVLRVLKLLKPSGAVVIPEISGDTASWSQSFHKVRMAFDPSNSMHDLEPRTKFLRFVRKTHEMFERKRGWINTRPHSASDAQPVIAMLEGCGCMLKKSVEKGYTQTINEKIDYWLEQLRAPIFSTIPPGLEATDIDELIKLKPHDISADARHHNVFSVFILSAGLNVDATSRDRTANPKLRFLALDTFSELWALGGDTKLLDVFTSDLRRIARTGLATGRGLISGIFYEHGIRDRKWRSDVGFISPNEVNRTMSADADEINVARISDIVRVGAYFKAIAHAADAGNRPQTLAEILYEALPRKITLHARYEPSATPTVKVVFRREGAVERLDIIAPKLDWDEQQFGNLREAVQDFDKNTPITLGSMTELVAKIACPQISPPELTVDALTNAFTECFKVIGGIDDSVHWPEVPDENQMRQLARNITLGSLAAVELWHIPASVTLNEVAKVEGSAVDSRWTELATGGVIVLSTDPSNPMSVDSEAIIRCLQLRHRSLYLELQKRDLKKKSRAAAAAAVFARNFSHVIGSHVVSNPAFREALAGDLPRGEVDAATRGFDSVLSDYLRRGFNENPRRFWQDGRDALRANHAHYRGGGALMGSSRDFHEYLQGRFDYIARAIDETKDQPEPVFFVSDLLDGFLKQSAFLHTFVADLGLRLPDIRFRVELPKSATETVAFRSEWEPQLDDSNQKPGGFVHRWRQVDQSGNPNANAQAGKSGSATIYAHDVLVGLPGGMVSAHAFYSLLENLIRNSVKYSRADETDYELKISLTDKGAADGLWQIALTDEWSKPTGKVFEEIKTKLEAPFVDSEGKPQRHGLGLLEMQACAKALHETAGQDPNLRPQARKWAEPVEPPPGTAQPPALPVVLANAAASPANCVVAFSALQDLATHPNAATLDCALIDGTNAATDEFLNELQSHEQALPRRLLVVYSDEDASRASREKWGKYLQSEPGQNLRDRLQVLAIGNDAPLLQLARGLDPVPEPKTGEPKKDTTSHQALVMCWEAWREPLTYEMTLRQPLLVAAVVAPQTGGAASGKLERIGRTTARGDSIKALAEQGRGAHLAIIDGDSVKINECIGEIAHYHAMLPYRFLVVCNSGKKQEVDELGEITSVGQKEEWEAAIEKDGRIPKNRVQVCYDDNGKGIDKLGFKSTKVEFYGSPDDEKRLALRCYEAWLRAWKSDELSNAGGECHLWIGLEREAQQVADMWKVRLGKFGTDDLTKDSFVKIAVRSYTNNTPGEYLSSWKNGFLDPNEKDREKAKKAEEAYWKEVVGRERKKLALVFDNHGRCFPEAGRAEKSVDFRQSARFYQKLSGTETPDLFRLLTHPPASEFGFAFFIYGLVEACLANVMVVDERVAADLLLTTGEAAKVNLSFAQDLASHQKAGVFPVFTFTANEGAADGHYTAQHARAFDAAIKGKAIANGEAKKEGVRFAPAAADATLTLLAPALLTNGDAPEIAEKETEQGFRLLKHDSAETPRCDVLVIHEGALDLLTDAVGWNRDDHCKNLLKISPAVIRTSGRGRESRRFGEWVPFIEFSEVSSALLTARNKFSLVRGLLGATAEHLLK